MKRNERYRSVSFDRAAETYDQTRDFPPGISQAVASTLRARLSPQDKVLEIGVGTGRIARPLCAFGLPVVGIDLSRRMMARLVEKEAGENRLPDLVQGDAVFLPFAKGSFGTIVVVHVFHLVGDLPACIQSVLRVLRRPGMMAVGWQWHPPDSASALVRRQWRLILQAQGADLSRPGLRGMGPALQLLEEHALRSEEAVAAEWEMSRSPSEIVGEIGRRDHSSAWAVPDEIFPQCHQELVSWARKALPNWDQPRAELRRFVWRLFWI
ncbi:MAG: class I SAM-dependent methyltransferase [Anaerolineales bacterium]|jgi:SAM-dependent methyltransferase